MSWIGATLGGFIVAIVGVIMFAGSIYPSPEAAVILLAYSFAVTWALVALLLRHHST